jgi:Ca2+-transporting ATPase
MSLWHTRTGDEVLKDLESAPEGLSEAEARRRLEHYGPNDIKETKKRTPLGMLLDQFKDFMIIVLIAAAVISGFIGELTDTIAIIVIVILNAIIGFVQEYRAQKALEALKQMAAPTATVRRDGKVRDLPVLEIVLTSGLWRRQGSRLRRPP